MIRIFAVSGWAVPPNWFQRTLEQEIRDCSVLAIYPYTSNRYEESVKSLEEASVDIYMGYSLGSLWLQKHRHLIPQDALVCHLAPVLAYPLEKGRGGKIARGRLDYLKKWIRRHPDSLELVLEFLESNKIFFAHGDLENLPDRQSLIDGLDYLTDVSVDSVDGLRGVFLAGQNDPLLSADELKQEIPQLIMVENASHDPVSLIRALVKQKLWSEHLQSIK